MYITEGWRFSSADFSCVGEEGFVRIERIPEQMELWHRLPEDVRNVTSIYVTGFGWTFQEALDDVNTKAASVKPIEMPKWEPPEGNWGMAADNTAFHCSGGVSLETAGRKRKTEFLAQRAAKASRERDRLEALRDQYRPEWEADWSDNKQEKWCAVYYQGSYEARKTWSARALGTVYGPEEFAVGAANMLNSGEMEL